MKLFPYQEEAVRHAVENIFERGNSLIVAGTGAGKTIMMAAAIGRFFYAFSAKHARKPHVLVLVHRTEIHTQNHSKFSWVCPEIQTSEITAERKSVHGHVHFAMVQTAANIMPELMRGKCFFDLIVIDEAHHAAASTYESIIEQNRAGNPSAALLGVTATPNRGDKLPLIHLFDNFYQITTRFLLDSHYLVRPEFLDLSPVFLGGEKGHITKNVREDEDGNEIIAELCDRYLENKLPGKAMIFAPNHNFCKRIYEYLKRAGRSPSYLYEGISAEERRAETERFEKGEGTELINVDICTEGYDFPPLTNLVDFDTNGTHGQWVQKVGRVLRTHPKKTACLVIDFGGNVDLYPEGLDAEVDLNGAVKKPAGERLCPEDFDKPQKEQTEKRTAAVLLKEEKSYTPYHLPEGFETVSDSDFGIVYVSCGKTHDCIITKEGEDFRLWTTDKKTLTKSFLTSLDGCIRGGISAVGKVTPSGRKISPLQIRLLSPEYPTMTLDRDGADCCICWKLWKEEIKNA